MSIKPNISEYDEIVSNPITNSLYNYGYGVAASNPPVTANYMITEILGDFMEMETSTDLMITEF